MGATQACGCGGARGGQSFGDPQIHRDPGFSSPPPIPFLGIPMVRNTETPACPSPQPLAWDHPYRQVHKTQRGDDATDEADDEGAVRHEHHLGSGAHGHPSRQRGVLDVHLGRGGRQSVLSLTPSPRRPAVHGAAWPQSQGWLRGHPSEGLRSAPVWPGSGQPPVSSAHVSLTPAHWVCPVCTDQCTCVQAGEPRWHACMFPLQRGAARTCVARPTCPMLSTCRCASAGHLWGLSLHTHTRVRVRGLQQHRRL